LLVLVAAAVANEQLFNEHIQKYNKQYSLEELSYRYGVFSENLKEIARLNREHVAIGGAEVFGIGPFTALTKEEFAGRYLMRNHPAADYEVMPTTSMPADYKPRADGFDWRNHTPAVVTAVKDQKQCGSCWAFSATETIESAWALAGNAIAELSPQQIVDCDKSDGGCNGGDTPSAYAYVQKAGGLEGIQSYPYTARNGRCAFAASSVVAKISGFTYATRSRSETEMQSALEKNGPLSVCVDASSWQNYHSGVLKSCSSRVDHCVQITGYGTMTGTPVWNVRNSWGSRWGVDGFIYVESGKNLCAIASEATNVKI